jgi:hypothetical protein
MADDPTKRDYRDRDRINIHERHELEYWSQKWNVAPDVLKAAVEKVGVMVKDVALELEKQQP